MLTVSDVPAQQPRRVVGRRRTPTLVLESLRLLVVVFLKVGYPAVKKALEARTERIRTDLDEAEQAKQSAEGVLSEYKAQLADAKTESNRIIEEARVQAERVKTDMIAATQAEVNELKAKAAADIDAARTQAMASLRSSVSEIAIEIAEKVVEKNLDRDTNRHLVESFINQVGG